MRSVIVFLLILFAGTHVAGQPEDKRAAELMQLLRRAKNDLEKANAQIELAHHYMAKPGAEAADMKKARGFLDDAAQTNKTLQSAVIAGNILLEDSQIEKETGHRNIGLKKLQEAIRVFRRANAPGREGRALMELRHYYGLEGQELKKRIAIVGQAAHCFVRSGDKPEEGNVYLELGDLYRIMGEPAEAIFALRKTIQLYEESRYGAMQSVYNLIGNAYIETGDFENALRYGHLAVKVLEELRDTSFVAATTYNRLGITYFRIGNLEMSMECFEKALTYAIRNNWDNGVAEITANIAELSIRLGSKMEPHIHSLEGFMRRYSGSLQPRSRHFAESLLRQFYVQLGDVKKAGYYLRSTLPLELETDITDRIMLYRDAVLYYNLTGDVKNSSIFLAKFKALTAKVSNPRHLELYYIVAYKTDSSHGRFREALDNHKRYKQYADTISARRSKREIRVMDARFNLDRKDAEIRNKSENIFLLQRNIEAQTELLNRGNVIRKVIIAAVIILLLLVLSLYSRWKIGREYSHSVEEKNSKLEVLLKEKEWLIREVHHRVKNNLQMIVSLIDSQASYLNNGALDAVLDSKHRIEAMSLIHQKLYLSEDVTTVNMRWYINELITYLKDCIGSHQNILFASDLEEVYLDVSNAVPIGLILNEAITNSIKHAFPDDEPGRIHVVLGCEDEKVNLIISDNGIGLNPDFDTRNAGSLGMNLMYGLAAEVGGQLTIDGTDGTTVSVSYLRHHLSGSAAELLLESE